jgi:hypothetical protein
VRLRLAGGANAADTPGMSMARERRARMALPRGTADGLSASEPDPMPSVVRRSDAEIARMRAVSERAAGIGRDAAIAAGAEFASPDTHAEGFLLALRWLTRDVDDVSVLLNWIGEGGEIPS